MDRQQVESPDQIRIVLIAAFGRACDEDIFFHFPGCIFPEYLGRHGLPHFAGIAKEARTRDKSNPLAKVADDLEKRAKYWSQRASSNLWEAMMAR